MWERKDAQFALFLTLCVKERTHYAPLFTTCVKGRMHNTPSFILGVTGRTHDAPLFTLCVKGRTHNAPLLAPDTVLQPTVQICSINLRSLGSFEQNRIISFISVNLLNFVD